MAAVEVIKATRKGMQNNPAGTSNEKLKVAAYCRVSTDNDEQLESYKSQVQHYTALIRENPEWSFVDVYADEAITGTMVDKRENFQRMINDCMAGKIDLIITNIILPYLIQSHLWVQSSKALATRGFGDFVIFGDKV